VSDKREFGFASVMVTYRATPPIVGIGKSRKNFSPETEKLCGAPGLQEQPSVPAALPIVRRRQ
jgi:hypothetical protein